MNTNPTALADKILVVMEQALRCQPEDQGMTASQIEKWLVQLGLASRIDYPLAYISSVLGTARNPFGRNLFKAVSRGQYRYAKQPEVKREDAFTQELPTVPGWYWKRTETETTIVCLTEAQVGYLLPWPEKRDGFMERLRADKTMPMKVVKEFEAMPDSHWIVEWAGPLSPPA